MCSLLNWKIVHCNYMYSLSALYTLQYVSIVTYSCKLLYSKKKKKKKTRTLIWVKIPKLCHKKPCYQSFLLGKGGNPYVSKPYLKRKTKLKCAFCPAPSTQNIFDSDTVWMTHTKIDQNKFTFPQILHLSSNRRVCNLTLYFQFTTLARELTHRTKFKYPERHEFWQHHVSSLP